MLVKTTLGLIGHDSNRLDIATKVLMGFKLY